MFFFNFDHPPPIFHCLLEVCSWFYRCDISDVEKCQTEGFDWQNFIRTDKKLIFLLHILLFGLTRFSKSVKMTGIPKRFQYLWWYAFMILHKNEKWNGTSPLVLVNFVITPPPLNLWYSMIFDKSFKILICIFCASSIIFCTLICHVYRMISGVNYSEILNLSARKDWVQSQKSCIGGNFSYLIQVEDKDRVNTTGPFWLNGRKYNTYTAALGTFECCQLASELDWISSSEPRHAKRTLRVSWIKMLIFLFSEYISF